MSFRTGTSQQVRRTAAKQLVDIVGKAFRLSFSDREEKRNVKMEVAPQDEKEAEDIKPEMTDIETTVVLPASSSAEEAWTEVLETVSKLLPLLKSKSSETRQAAAFTIGLLASSLPTPSSSSESLLLDTEPPNFPDLLRSGQTLLASAGREYISKPNMGDKAKRKKAMMGSLGIGDGLGWGDEVDGIIGEGDDEVEVEKKEEEGPPRDVFEGLSQRQIAMLKRKKGNVMEEANKMRKLNEKAIPTPTSNPSTPVPSSAVSTPGDSAPVPGKSEVVTIDPGAKARAAAATTGGHVEPTLDSEGNLIQPTGPSKTVLVLVPGHSPWAVVVLELMQSLAEPAWEVRHGSALALLELLRPVGASFPQPLLIGIARELLQLMALDRFGDFVGDTVVAPVRETASQTLGITMKYLGTESVREIHLCLMEMVTQPWAKRGRDVKAEKWEKFSWEIRHAGLLGLMYEVAVRGDLLGVKFENERMDVDTKPDVDMKPDVKAAGSSILEDVVSAAILALTDQDDDVRTVAALALLPIASQLAGLPSAELEAVVDALWGCLGEDGDELGSSTGAVMDLLGGLIGYPQVIAIMARSDRQSGPHSRSMLIARIFSFIRHTIPSVRLSVIKSVLTFITVPALPKADWLDSRVLSLLFQNLILEERTDVREVSASAFETALREVGGKVDELDLVNWYTLSMTPVGSPLDVDLFVKGSLRNGGGHNVDKNIVAGDMSLITVETVLSTRIAAAKALSLLRLYPTTRDLDLLHQYLSSASAHQLFLASVIVQEWAKSAPPTEALGVTDAEAQTMASTLVEYLSGPPPETYHEMTVILTRIYSECAALLQAFVTEGKLNKDKLPALPATVDPLSNSADVFSLTTAKATIGPTFDKLSGLLSKHSVKNNLGGLKDRQRKIMGSIGYFSVMKDRFDTMVGAGVAGALIGLKVMPAKLGVVIKSVMDSLKKEEQELLQIRSAESISAFIIYCSSPLFQNKVNPSDKVVKNLFTFLCQDTATTPVFTPTSTDGILALKEDKVAASKKGKEDVEESEDEIKMRITRRGAYLALKEIARSFGGDVRSKVPKYWEGLSAGLLEAFTDGTPIDELDAKLVADTQSGQALVDTLSSLRLLSGELSPDLSGDLVALFSPIILALQSSHSLVRNMAAQALAALCDVVLVEGMKRIVDDLLPLIGDSTRVESRRGAVEGIHHIIKVLEIKALPYVLFLIVPILGRMSDPDESVRLLSTSTFASLVKMVPLEAGIPDPPGFSADLLAKRDEERQFLMQLLDGSKAEQYQIPIPIKADLRQYQKDGVSWLAFLAKYQLHGILCDDMGLGKSLQTICIVGSKNFERVEKHKISKSVDSAHLPSLIVCPPTLTGHWYYEISKFTDHLSAIQYVGNGLQRTALRNQLSKFDVVITSYEVVRNDIDFLSKMNWLYCVLDEGHIIKNAKTKLSAAVKQLQANHRLLLSGTPIQNNVLELWSLFDFLMPGFLGNDKLFNDRFSKPILADRDGKATPKERELATSALEALHRQVLPFLLRRLKEDVLHDLPPKIIQDYYCELSPIQKQLYDEFSKSKAAEEAGEVVSSSDAGGGQGQQHVFQSLQYLRKLCNHPKLVLDNDPARTKALMAKLGSGTPGIDDITQAPKLEALKQLLTDCGIGLPPNEKLESPHRVLIFCQLRPMLDLIETDLFKTHMPTVTYMRMDGNTDPKKRHAVVQTFNADPNIDVLLLTTSVGGLGLNLTGADTVIFVDHDWNPMKDLQAMDRAHRLGQKKVVNVYRLIMRGTLEEKIMGLQRFKLNIASSVVTQQNSGLGSMNTGEVLDLFKVPTDQPSQAKASTSSGPVSQSKVLEGLEDLPPEDEYAELTLSNFMSRV
ncbi:TATA-binding protein-associated factor, partial [Tremellales sp. Uapishka_1]